MSYQEIMQKVKRDKDIEKMGIIDRLGNMSIEERAVENDLKNYRIGRWNVGEQKGLYQYDKKTFDREIDELLAQGEDNIDVMIDADDIVVDHEGEDADDIYNRGAVDIGNIGDNYMDGAYYEEDRENDDEF